MEYNFNVVVEEKKEIVKNVEIRVAIRVVSSFIAVYSNDVLIMGIHSTGVIYIYANGEDEDPGLPMDSDRRVLTYPRLEGSTDKEMNI